MNIMAPRVYHHHHHCAVGFSELGAADRAKADGIISGFRRRRIYPRSILSRDADHAAAAAAYSLVIIYNVIVSCSS